MLKLVSRTFVVCLLIGLASGCGQKGPLMLPQEQDAPKQEPASASAR